MFDLERVFPSQECLSDEAIDIIESSYKLSLLGIFSLYRPRDMGDGIKRDTQVHLQDPFSIHTLGVGIRFRAKEEFPEAYIKTLKRLEEKTHEV